MKTELQKIVDQLKLGKYTCTGGNLEQNTSFIRLVEIAEEASKVITIKDTNSGTFETFSDIAVKDMTQKEYEEYKIKKGVTKVIAVKDMTKEQYEEYKIKKGVTKVITIKEPDLGSFKDILSIDVGINVDGYGSDLAIEFKDGSLEGYSFVNNGK